MHPEARLTGDQSAALLGWIESGFRSPASPAD